MLEIVDAQRDGFLETHRAQVARDLDAAFVRFLNGGGSYLSARDPRQVFGLGKDNKPGRLSVTWPNGKEQHWDGLAPDRYYRLTQGKEKAEQRPTGKR